ncbi:potassium-transporting ATPase subunit C [Planotetraspora kaengkrachanensis]|uniref:Potassium-transporting ATPase KdpC subunit n=1 Tax=Planotetraspora kaengkrachanensis TaxID=575193 RepID=A0A8J3LV84_9ACTN|nr:potassium-transporting ATPase subunit C [Planotetraspora kaengkrachanensis]GIG79377.1 potassium-transporting ATPase KdpC subunit [Planotetraspora kaengkrachanensis]
MAPMTRAPGWLVRLLAAVRALLVITALTGVIYPIAVWSVALLPGLHDRAQGSMVTSGGRTVGSEIIGQSFAGRSGDPLRRYFQSRPSNAGAGYDPTSTGAGNLGPEDIVDTLPENPARKAAEIVAHRARDSLLTQVCARSRAVGALEGVDGSRPFCTPGGAGAVLSLIGPRDRTGHVTRPTRVVSVNEQCGVVARPFIASYAGRPVECARHGGDYRTGEIVPIRGGAPATPVVPADAVTASGSGLDPHISPAYARLQAPRVARERGIPEAEVLKAIAAVEEGRVLGFIGTPRVNVLRLNIELDRRHPIRG